MPRTPMSDTPLSPVNEYYKVLNKRIMETSEDKKKRKKLLKDEVEVLYKMIQDKQSTLDRYETLPAKLAELKIRGKIDEIDEAFNLGIDKAIRVVNAIPKQNTGLQDKIDRYEKALREIAKLKWNDTNHHLIASNALNDK